MGFGLAIGIAPALAELEMKAARAKAEGNAFKAQQYGDVIDVEATDITDRKAITHGNSEGCVRQADGPAQARLPGPASE